jgi:molybdopterin/thiamine biosynthesis adenylyltransferase
VADGERLEWGNVVRHAAGLSDVGRLKSRIVADLIKDRNPYADVWGVSTELASASKDTYEKAIASADVVICATDSRASRLICNRLCVKHRKRVIFGGLTGGAYSGMVFQCQSPGTMCYHCFVSLFPETAADRESNESAYSGGPDGHLALDIGPITNLMAKLALVELQKQVGVVAGGLDGDLTHPWYLWINRRDGEYAEVATPLGAGGGGPEILRWYPLPMEKFEGCPHCGTGPG